MLERKITLALCGDVLLSRRLPNRYPETLKEISDMLKAQDCSFGNLETTIHDREGYPELFPGGSYTMSSPFCLRDLTEFGFNVFNTANNHSMDYSHGGLLATIRHLDELGIPHCGTGKNLADACAPAFVECQNGRVAFIGVTSSFHDSYAAGPQNQDLLGRPGVNPLRHNAVYELDERNFDDLVRIASASGINSYHDQARKEGYLPKEENFKFGSFNFKKGVKNELTTTPNASDLQRTIDTISDCRYSCDVVVVSIHSHQFIDAGADVVVCHGPHVTRGISEYGKGIIFHGLGNFILQHETMSVVGEEQYRKVGLTRETCTGVGGVIDKRGKGGTIGLSADPNAWESYFVTLTWSPEGITYKKHDITICKEKNNGLPSLKKGV